MVGMKGSLLASLVMRIDVELTLSGSAPAGIVSTNVLSADFTMIEGGGAGVVFAEVTGPVSVALVLFIAGAVELCDNMLGGVVVLVILPLICVVVMFDVFTTVVNGAELVIFVVVLVVVCILLVKEEVLVEGLQDGNNAITITNRTIDR